MLKKVSFRRNALQCVFTISILLFSSGCNKEVKVSKYTSMQVISGNFKKVVESKGIIKPMSEETITVASDVWGNLEKLIPEGTKVKKGDFVARINVREMLENYNNASERYATTKVDAAKQKADLPVEILKIDSELNQKKNDLSNKSIDYKLLKRGPKDDVRTKVNTDIDVSKLKLDNNTLNKKRELYKKGYVSQQEINTSEIEFQTFDSDLKKAEISKIQLTPEYQKPDITKSRLTEEQASLDVKINSIENQARKSSLKTKERNGDFRVKRYMSRMKRFERSLKMAEMTAPIDGVVIYPKIWGWRKAFIGMEVWDGFSFMNIAQTDKLKIETKINEQEIVNIKPNQDVEIKIASLPNQTFQGKVLKIGKLAKYLDERNPEGLKYFDVDISISDKLTQLKPNMNVDLKVVCSDQSKAYYIPAEALVEEGKNYFVYFDENNQPVKKSVKVKERSQDYILLEDKLSGKEKFYIMPASQEKI